MKRKGMAVMCCIFLLISGITALCNKNVQNMFVERGTDMTDFETEFEFGFDFGENEPIEMMTGAQFELGWDEVEEFSIESVEAAFSDMCAVIAENDFDTAEAMKIKNNFIATAVNYGMDRQETDYVKKLFEEGYDIEKVLEIYEFIRWTDCGIDAIEGIYDAGIGNSDSEHWVYEAYDKFFDRTDDILSVEDIAYYVGRGITADEIAGAYELSFAGEKSTKEMLAERLEGKDWNEIAASSLSKTPEIVVNAPEMSMDEIMAFRNICVRLRKDFAEIADVQEDCVEISEDARLAERWRITEKDRLAVKYDVTPIADEVREESKIEYANDKPHIFAADEECEEDLIPLEEPEVE